jgi:hypothetical protein
MDLLGTRRVIIRQNTDGELGMEPRRGVFRIPRTFGEGGGESR